MNREFKFRVWSLKYKQWINHCAVIDCGGKLGSHFVKVDENNNVIEHLVGLSAEDNIIQQFTGLKDLNGKEIYEFDILNDPTYPEDDWERSIVKYSDEYARFVLNFYSPEGP